MTYETIVELLFKILHENITCEDNTIKIKNKLKYDVHNMLEYIEPIKMKLLYDELEYNEGEE